MVVQGGKFSTGLACLFARDNVSGVSWEVIEAGRVVEIQLTNQYNM
jgi:hypothetical protein